MNIDSDGWVSLNGPDGLDGLHLRIRVGEDGRFRITDLYLHAPEITSRELREISMARLEATINTAQPERVAGLAQLLGAEYGYPTPDGGMVLYGGGEPREPSLAELRERVPPKTRAKRARRRRKPLTRPGGTDPDVFYRLVADAYQEYVPQTKAPATRIAAEADVPVTTAHRWIREARRRGFLPPARKGRAG